MSGGGGCGDGVGDLSKGMLSLTVSVHLQLDQRDAIGWRTERWGVHLEVSRRTRGYTTTQSDDSGLFCCRDIIGALIGNIVGGWLIGLSLYWIYLHKVGRRVEHA